MYTYNFYYYIVSIKMNLNWIILMQKFTIFFLINLLLKQVKLNKLNFKMLFKMQFFYLIAFGEESAIFFPDSMNYILTLRHFVVIMF